MFIHNYEMACLTDYLPNLENGGHWYYDEETQIMFIWNGNLTIFLFHDIDDCESEFDVRTLGNTAGEKATHREVLNSIKRFLESIKEDQ